jgi:Tfp pilus assembly protein PilF
LNKIPPTHETFERYRLEAMVADSKKEWKKADSFYEIAAGLTTKPAGVLNNWGFSKLSRKEFGAAEKLFTQALTYDPTLFTAKNNLVMSRGAQRKYDMPVIEMTQIERAELLYTLGLTAVKQGDITVGKGLLQNAVDTHPQHFEAAVRSLAALES